MIKIHIDFETRSDVDLKKAGAHVYSEGKRTDVLCMAYAIGENGVRLWKYGESFPGELRSALKRDDCIFVAHNAAFEFLIWNHVCVKKYNWPPLPLKKLDCTMIRAFSMGLPGTLERAAKAVGMPFEKDMKGHRIMLQLCKPRKVDFETGELVWWHPDDSTKQLDITEKYRALYRYCIQDVTVERELDRRLLALDPNEKKLWFLDQKINYRGVMLDESACQNAIKAVAHEQKRFNQTMRDLTDNTVSSCNATTALVKWINSQGVPVKTVQKSDVLALLEEENLPEKVRTALLLRQEASRSSAAKLKSMSTSKSKDGRVRGCFQYYGAASTGRWSGRRIQLQNLKRPNITQAEIELIKERLINTPSDESREYLETFYGSVIDPITDCVRAMLVSAPGKRLIACDFAAIEGRVLAWLAGQESVLNVFRSHGKIYEHTASQIYEKSINEITKDERLIGKVATLALGYQGGVGAFQSMARIYYLKLQDDFVDAIKARWREKNPHIVNYWYALERCAIQAHKRKGEVFSCGPEGRKVKFKQSGSFLFCRLPSGRNICYPYPKIKEVRTPWGAHKKALTYKSQVFSNFLERAAYGGLLAENVTQAKRFARRSAFTFRKFGIPYRYACP